MAKLPGRVLDRYGDRITGLVGGSLGGTNFEFYRGGDYAGASGFASPGTVHINRKFWRDMSAEDRKGFLIHELTHVARGAKSGDREERIADAARFALYGERDGWEAQADQKRYARKHGWLDGGNVVQTRPAGEPSFGPQLPSLEGGGRKRNTLANALSKGTGTTNPGGLAALPSLSPEQTANYYSQLGNLYAQYQLQKVAARQQRVGLRAGFQTAKAGIRSELISGLAGTENAAIERGVAGSSADLQARSDVRGAAAAAKAEARGEMLTGLAQTRLAEQQAGIEFQMGAADLQASKLAAQQSLLAQQLQQNLIISGQESQLDVLRQIYAAQVAGYQNGRPGQRKPRPVHIGFQNTDTVNRSGGFYG